MCGQFPSRPYTLTYDGILSAGDVNLSSVRARQDRGKYLSTRARIEEIDFVGFLEELSQRVIALPERTSIFAARRALTGAAISLVILSWGGGCRTAQPAAAKPAAEAPQQKPPARPSAEATPEQASTQPRGGASGSETSKTVDELLRGAHRRDAALGIQTIGGLQFDPQGADFTAWVNEFHRELNRNWILPAAAVEGQRGHVDFEFTVERHGKVSVLVRVLMLKSSKTPALDRAALNAIKSSHFLPLPAEYKPPQVTMVAPFSTMRCRSLKERAVSAPARTQYDGALGYSPACSPRTRSRRSAAGSRAGCADLCSSNGCGSFWRTVTSASSTSARVALWLSRKPSP
jgi:TonB family protein